MSKKYDNFREKEYYVSCFCDEEVTFGCYEGDDIIRDYISNVFTYYIQDQIIGDILANGYDEELIDLIGDVSVGLPDELIDYYRDAVNLDDFSIPKEKIMTPVKMNKNTVSRLINENTSWFKDQENNLRYLSLAELETAINLHLKKKASEKNQILVKTHLGASTLTALVKDGVLERKFNEASRCYSYCPILLTNSEDE